MPQKHCRIISSIAVEKATAVGDPGRHKEWIALYFT